jgi:hypothetical protein
LDEIEWKNVIDYIFRHVLVDPKKLETICPECHKKEHNGLHKLTPDLE